MSFDPNAFLIITTGSMIAISCGLLGVFLMLRKMAMTGDAISHAVLPGIVIAFLVSGSRHGLTMVIGAGLVGILATVFIEYLSNKVKLQSDASIGITFTSLFALGIIMITFLANEIDLDQDCVLYGEIAYVPIDLWITGSGKIIGPRVTYLSLINMVLVIGFIILFFKELKISTFDKEFAATLGLSTVGVNYALMGMVSYTTVSSFEAVGAILVVALMVVPPATAYLWTKNLYRLIQLTVVLGVVISFLGYYMAYFLNSSIAGAMASVAGFFFFTTVILQRRQIPRIKKKLAAVKVGSWSTE
ncbi:metal ABC transporter permease [Echinicola vietnamensis]|uniref:ABC-type Mn2+/Zn2+ transport system, permease component n=1 Tax=Echinicola vietnamensis (strain DSM 17526 / LMG 23754 / KMM 6221) TaxID=926556 RepID=L0G421_ECHVK|nr:metal ABC transporter permease [Echinicola vietnamensis]AGA79761.1 ABC-type Mn2+/Zn2+ transport system, permease component [Echinicola vietnamensis DSM 17526]